MKIGGTIRFEGQGLKWITKEKDGSGKLVFEDSGSCETTLSFSPENFRRLADAALGFALNKESTVKFDEDKGTVAADDLVVMMSDQAVSFTTEDDKQADDIPTLLIQPIPNKGGKFDGLCLEMNEKQAAEIVRRLGGFLESIRVRREASKPKRIDPPAITKKARSQAAA